MTNDEPRLPSSTVSVVYEDLPDLIEIEVRVVSGDRPAITRVYTSPSLLVEEAAGPPGLDGCPHEKFTLDAGAGHTGIRPGSNCAVRCGRSCRPSRVPRQSCHECDRRQARASVAIESGHPEETASVERFARQLVAVAETLTGEATLAVPDARAAVMLDSLRPPFLPLPRSRPGS